MPRSDGRKTPSPCSPVSWQCFCMSTQLRVHGRSLQFNMSRFGTKESPAASTGHVLWCHTQCTHAVGHTCVQNQGCSDVVKCNTATWWRKHHTLTTHVILNLLSVAAHSETFGCPSTFGVGVRVRFSQPLNLESSESWTSGHACVCLSWGEKSHPLWVEPFLVWDQKIGDCVSGGGMSGAFVHSLSLLLLPPSPSPPNFL